VLVTDAARFSIIQKTTGSPEMLALQQRLDTATRGLLALEEDEFLRDGLRYISGSRRVFMPDSTVVDRLRALGLVEPAEGGVSVGMPDDYRPTGLGSELLPAIGVRG